MKGCPEMMMNAILTAWTTKLFITAIDKHYLKFEMEDIEVWTIRMLQEHIVENVAVNCEQLKAYDCFKIL